MNERMEQWTRMENGVWRMTLGQPDGFDPVHEAGMAPRREALSNLGEATFPAVFKDLVCDIDRNKGQVLLRLPLQANERIYGLGLQFKRVNHRGRTRFLRVNSDPSQDTGETHAPVPFLVSSNGYGLLFNTARIVTVHCGSTGRRDSRQPPVARDNLTDPDFSYTPVSDMLEATSRAVGMELYLFAGPSMRMIVQRYNLFFGGGALPPKWGLGFWHRVPATHTDRQVLEEALVFREKKFPCDVIGLEPGWHSSAYPATFSWSESRFPDPQGFMDAMKTNGFRINLWEHAYVSPKSPLYSELELLSGSHSVWGGLAPDFSIPRVKEIFQAQHRKDHLSVGVCGYKLDECDGSELTGFSWMFPAHAEFPSGHDGEQMRQLYGLLLQLTMNGLYREQGMRTYGLVRASHAAASSLPFVLYSDLYDHREFVRALCNASFCGLLWTPEVRSAVSAEDWVRRFQTLCFSPLAILNAWADGTKPWSFPEATEIVLRYVRLRMRLLPYFYSAFARYRHEGIPPFRAMHLENDYDPETVGAAYRKAVGYIKRGPLDLLEDELDTQYMAGDSLLVAPMFAGQKERLVWLPSGDWFRMETGEKLVGGQFVNIQADLAELPVFVRDGTILPMMPVMERTPFQGESISLELWCYGETPGLFNLYDDDGETLSHESGAYRWIRLETACNENGKRTGRVIPQHGNYDTAYHSFQWIFIGSECQNCEPSEARQGEERGILS